MRKEIENEEMRETVQSVPLHHPLLKVQRPDAPKERIESSTLLGSSKCAVEQEMHPTPMYPGGVQFPS